MNTNTDIFFATWSAALQSPIESEEGLIMAVFELGHDRKPSNLEKQKIIDLMNSGNPVSARLWHTIQRISFLFQPRNGSMTDQEDEKIQSLLEASLESLREAFCTIFSPDTIEKD